MTAYNWENNASNAGNDYQYQNDGYLSASNTPGEAVRGLVETAHGSGAAALLTVPIVDYVAADKNGGGDIRNSANYQTTRLKANKAAKGSAFSTTPDSTDANVYQDESRWRLAGLHLALEQRRKIYLCRTSGVP